MEDLQKDFVPYDFALRLKPLLFKERVLTYYEYGIVKMYYNVDGWDFNSSFLNCCSRPTFSQAFRWFREELKYEVFLQKQENLLSGKTYSFLIEDDLEGIYTRSLSKSSIDEAELACLEKLLKIVEQDGKDKAED